MYVLTIIMFYMLLLLCILPFIITMFYMLLLLCMRLLIPSSLYVIVTVHIPYIFEDFIVKLNDS